MHYIIKWKNNVAKGFVDLIDAGHLQVRKSTTGLKHQTIKGRDIRVSSFDIELEPGRGTLLFRYGGGQNRIANDEEGIDLGDMRIDPAEFPTATNLQWRTDGKDWEDRPVVIMPLDWEEGERRKSHSTYILRNPTLSRFKLAEALLKGPLSCEACGFSGYRAYGRALQRCFEVHHKHPIKDGNRKTTLDDLAILCANCHNAIHGLGDMKFEEFVKLVQDGLSLP